MTLRDLAVKACINCKQRRTAASSVVDSRLERGDSGSIRTLSSPAQCDVVIPYDPVNLPWLKASVESILNQAGACCIIHLIADGFDDPHDPAPQFDSHPQVRRYRNDSVIGPYRTMHRVFDRLETPLVAIQDSDDIALPHRIQYSIDQLTESRAEIFGASMRQFVSYDASDEISLRRLKSTPIHTSGHMRWRLCPQGNIINGTLVMRRDTFQRLNGFASLMTAADLEFATRAHRAGCRIITSPEIVGLRRLHSTSLSHGAAHGAGTQTQQEAYAHIEAAYEGMTRGCDVRKFGGLASDRYDLHRTRRLNASRIPLRNLEIHVAHACNLSCQQCSHYSNHHHRGVLSAEEADRQMELWSARLAPTEFSLVGGEPTVNPHLCEIIRTARRHWPHSRLQLVTNGFLLHRHPDLPAVLEETGTWLEISVHHDGPEYQASIEPVRALVAHWESLFTLRVNWRSSNARWRRTYRGDGPGMRPYDDGDSQASWEICCAKWCPQIHDGRLWKCPQLAYLPMQADKHQLRDVPEWAPYLAYAPLTSNCSDEELAEFVSRQSESCCSMCPASVELFTLPSPLRRKADAAASETADIH